jgi:hypothetical protein
MLFCIQLSRLYTLYTIPRRPKELVASRVKVRPPWCTPCSVDKTSEPHWITSEHHAAYR